MLITDLISRLNTPRKLRHDQPKRGVALETASRKYIVRQRRIARLWGDFPDCLLAISSVIRKLQRETLRQMKTAAFDESRREKRSATPQCLNTRRRRRRIFLF